MSAAPIPFPWEKKDFFTLVHTSRYALKGGLLCRAGIDLEL